jgi:hypothetical protein
MGLCGAGRKPDRKNEIELPGKCRTDASKVLPPAALIPRSAEACTEMGMKIEPEEWQLLEILTWKLRVAAAQQLCGLGDKAAHALKRLLKKRWLSEEAMLVRILTLDQPLVSWKPGEPAPDVSALSWQLEARRHRTEPTISRIIWAHARARRLTGGCSGPIRQPLQVEHDLGTAAMFFRRNELDSSNWDQWLGEDILRQTARRRQPIPDAAHCSTDGMIRLAIEFGGAYSADRLRRFHLHCRRCSLPSELW